MKRGTALAFLGAAACAPVEALSASPRTLAWYAASVDGREHLGSSEDDVLPAASIIKLLITMTLVDHARAGTFDRHTRVALAAVDRVGGSDRFGTAAPRAYPATALIGAMLSASDNTASNALLRVAGMDRCNDVAVAHRLQRTRIRRRFYDWDAQRRGIENVTTARESAQLLLLVAAAAKEAGEGGAVARLAMRALLAQEDRETIPAALPNRRSVANKTGELPGVRNDVGIVGYLQKGGYVISLLDRYGDAPRSAAVDAIRRVVRTVDRKLGAATTP
jgi:beta-lactamase class A